MLFFANVKHFESPLCLKCAIYHICCIQYSCVIFGPWLKKKQQPHNEAIWRYQEKARQSRGQKDTCLLVDLDGGHVSLQPDNLSHQLAVADTDQLVHGCSRHGRSCHHYTNKRGKQSDWMQLNNQAKEQKPNKSVLFYFPSQLKYCPKEVHSACLKASTVILLRLKCIEFDRDDCVYVRVVADLVRRLHGRIQTGSLSPHPWSWAAWTCPSSQVYESDWKESREERNDERETSGNRKLKEKRKWTGEPQERPSSPLQRSATWSLCPHFNYWGLLLTAIKTLWEGWLLLLLLISSETTRCYQTV